MTDQGTKNIVMICPTSSQPRFHKRSIQLLNFFNIRVYAFNRGMYEQNSFSKFVNYTSLGSIQDGNYIKRIGSLLSALFLIKKRVSKNDFFYAMSLDCLLLAKLAGMKSGFYEVGDIRTEEKNGRFFLLLEKFMLSKVSGVVITSRYFFDDHYIRLDGDPSKFYLIENKLDYSYFNRKSTLLYKNKLLHGPIRIGLIGLFRYKNSITKIIEFVNNNPEKYELICYGDGPLLYLIKENQSQCIKYFGSFKYPEDIENIYENIDLNYVVYDNSSLNVRLALPNKLYESIFFSIPILCAQDTALGKEVESLGVGKVIDISSDVTFAESVKSIDETWVLNCKRNCQKIPRYSLLDRGDLILKGAIRSLEDNGG